MAESQASIDAQTSTLLSSLTAAVSNEETSLQAPSLNVPESLTLIKGNIDKYLKGEDESLLFARNTEAPQDNHKAASGAVHDNSHLSTTSSEQDEKKSDEEGEILKYILFTRTIEKRDNKVISESTSPVMCLLFDCELSALLPAGENAAQTHCFPKAALLSDKIVPKKFSASHYFRNQDFEKVRQVLHQMGFYFPQAKIEICSLGLMPEEVGEEIFEQIEEACPLTNDVSAFLHGLCRFQERDPEEVLCRAKIEALFKDANNPKRFAESVLLAKQYHEQRVAKNTERDLISCEANVKLILEDSRLALDLAKSLSTVSVEHAFEACSIYSKGAYFDQQAKELLMSLAIGFTEDEVTPNQKTTTSQKIRDMRSKGMHAAFQSWMRGMDNTYILEMMLKLIEMQAGCLWNQPKDRLFSPEMRSTLLRTVFPISSYMLPNFFGTIVTLLAENVFQFYPDVIQKKTRAPSNPVPVERPAVGGELLSGGESPVGLLFSNPHQTPSHLGLNTPELQKQAELQEKADLKKKVELKEKAETMHPIVQWFSESTEVPFPIPKLSIAEKSKLQLPDSFTLIAGNIEKLFSDNNSQEKVIFSVQRKDITMNEAPDSKNALLETGLDILSSNSSDHARDSKEQKEDSERILTHVVLMRVADVRFGTTKVAERPLTLLLLFNTTLVELAQNAGNVHILNEYQIAKEDIFEEIEGLELFHYITRTWDLLFKDGYCFGLHVEMMRPEFIDFVLDHMRLKDIHTQNKHALNCQEVDYLKKLCTFPVSLEEQKVFQSMKEKLLQRKWGDALQVAGEYHTNLRKHARKQNLIVEDGMVECSFEDSKMALLLAEFLQPIVPDAAIAALEMISAGSPWFKKAREKIFDIAVRLDDQANLNPHHHRKIRQKGITVLFSGLMPMRALEQSREEFYNSVQMVQAAQDRLNQMIRLIAVQAGINVEDFKPISITSMMNMGLDAIGYMILGFIEPLLEKLYEYRQEFSINDKPTSEKPLIFSFSAGTSALSLGVASGLESTDSENARIKGLDEDEDEVEDKLKLAK